MQLNDKELPAALGKPRPAAFRASPLH